MSETDPKHEHAVEEFIEGVRELDPERVAEVEARFPVLSDSELDWRRSREVRLSESFENTLSLSADIFGRRVAAPLTFRRNPVRKLFALVAMAAVFVACTPLPSRHAAAPSAPHCADLVAHAMTTQPPQPVVGAFACLNAVIRGQASANGITDDQSFAEYAAGAPVYTAYRYVGKSAGHPDRVFYYFELTPQQCYRLSVDSAGLVDGGAIGREGAACPSPLP